MTTDTRPYVTIRRVKLDAGGYDKHGGYFGIGAPVYSVVTDDGETYRGVHVRAASYRALADDYRARGYHVTR